jgi:rubredoxin
MAMSTGRQAGLPCPECTGDHTERVPLQFDAVIVSVYSCLECGHIWREQEPEPAPIETTLEH